MVFVDLLRLWREERFRRRQGRIFEDSSSASSHAVVDRLLEKFEKFGELIRNPSAQGESLARSCDLVDLIEEHLHRIRHGEYSDTLRARVTFRALNTIVEIWHDWTSDQWREVVTSRIKMLPNLELLLDDRKNFLLATEEDVTLACGRYRWMQHGAYIGAANDPYVGNVFGARTYHYGEDHRTSLN